MKEYKGVKYTAFYNDHIGHYCGYVRLPDNHPFVKLLSKKRWFQLGRSNPRRYRYDYDAVPVEAHGGLTFGEYINDKKLDFPQGFTKGWWIGWDYGHICDKYRFTMARYATCPDWTEELVEKECKRVIEQILKFENPELLG